MIPYIYSKWYYRLITGTLFGILTWLANEVLLSVRYRYFLMFSQPLNYFYAAILSLRRSIYLANNLMKANPGTKDL